MMRSAGFAYFGKGNQDYLSNIEKTQKESVKSVVKRK